MTHWCHHCDCLTHIAVKDEGRDNREHAPVYVCYECYEPFHDQAAIAQSTKQEKAYYRAEQMAFDAQYAGGVL